MDMIHTWIALALPHNHHPTAPKLTNRWGGCSKA